MIRAGDVIKIGAETLCLYFVSLSKKPDARGACVLVESPADADGYFVYFRYPDSREDYRRYLSYAELEGMRRLARGVSC